jgi:hypothetical protein
LQGNFTGISFAAGREKENPMNNSSTPLIFLCHAKEDAEQVRNLYENLKTSGLNPWMDEKDILPGQDWDYEIKQAIKRTNFAIVCLSERSVRKRGYVNKEIIWALDRQDEMLQGDIFLIPVKLESCDLPDRLSHCQAVNVFDSNGYERLMKVLKPSENQNGNSTTACSLGHFTAHIGDSIHKGLLPLNERLKQILPNQNPYVTGTSLPGNSPVFFGREQILHEILSALRKPGKPACISLLGERRIGKSSLLNQVCEALKTENSLISIYGNAQNWSQCTPEEFYRSLYQSICGALSVHPKADVNSFDLFRDVIREQARSFRFVLVMDEFEDMAANKNFGDTFFTSLRHLGERPEYAFGYLLASRRPLHEICHQNDIASSSFWNIFGISHILGLLQEHEAEALIREPMKRSLNGTLKKTESIWDMTGFHPALIQMVMDKYWTAFSGKYRPDKEQIIHGLRPYFHDLWQRRTKEEREILVHLAAGKTVKSNAALQDLKLRGLVCNGKPFSPLFAEIIQEMKPNDL